VLVVASRDVPTGLIVDEVVGFRRFGSADYRAEAAPSVIRCEHYLEGSYQRAAEVWPRFSLVKLLEDPQFLTAGEALRA
jgi:twitching motility protein PilI